MLGEAEKQAIQQAYSRWLEARDVQPRKGQRLMIAETARTLSRAGEATLQPPIAAIEAGTGTGKTLAYLIPALVMAKAMGKHLVIATATVSLQEQLLNKDLPELREHAGLDFDFALAKGRGRYVCNSKLMAYDSTGSAEAVPLSFEEEGDAPLVSKEAWQLYRDMAQALLDGEWDGDRDNWPDILEHSLWQPLTSDHLQCTGRKCAYIKECVYFTNRETLEGVSCIVANHDLVLADLALGGGAILTPPEDTFYIFDEAHQLPDKAQNHFGHRLRIAATRRWLEQLQKGLPALAKDFAEDSLGSDTFRRLVPAMDALGIVLEELYYTLEQLLEQEATNEGEMLERRFPINQLPESLLVQADTLLKATAQLEQLFNIVAARLQSVMDGDIPSLAPSLAEPWVSVIGQVQSRLAGLHGVAAAYREAEAEDSIPYARWLTGRDYSSGTEYEINAVPVVPDDLLSSLLWESCAGAVLTSASLTALGSFDRFYARAGLPEGSSCSQLPSPFNPSEAAVLHIPQDIADPSDSDAHTRMLVELFPRMEEPGKGMLVLFTSRRQMQDVYDQLPASFQDQVLNQDLWNRQALLRKHRERVDSGASSVIFGLASFAEGVDLPGDYCTHVVITRIPFSVPNDPLEASAAEWVSLNGGNAFMDISLPDASRRLLQASGRLLRTEGDTGKITILDKRLVTKRYGRDLIAALPPYRRVSDDIQALN